MARLGGVAGTRLLEIGGDEPWRHLTFADGEMSLPVLSSSDSEIAQRYGIGTEPAVFVIDAEGIVRWAQVGPMSLANPLEVARAISVVAAPFASAPNEEAKSSSDEHGVSWTRRDFVATTLAAAFALALRPLEANAERVAALDAPRSKINTRRVTLNVNGREIALDLEPRVTLLDALREYAGLTGTKKGCDHGQCGACTVHVDGRRTLSCMTFAVMQEGHRVTTIEGLASGERLHPMQQAFITHDGFQCGYCTSGQIMSAVAVLDESWGPGGRRRARSDEWQHLPVRRLSGNRRRGAGRPPRAGLEWRRANPMIDFEYVRATEIDAALSAGAEPSTKFVAGGTNLIDLMKLNVERPSHLIDINDLGRRRSLAQHDRRSAERRAAPGRARATCATSRGTRVCASDTPSSVKRCSSRLPGSSATWRPSAATCSSGRVVRTSATPQRRATSASPAQDARRSRVSIAPRRFSARATTASRRIRATSRWRLSR